MRSLFGMLNSRGCSPLRYMLIGVLSFATAVVVTGVISRCEADTA